MNKDQKRLCWARNVVRKFEKRIREAKASPGGHTRGDMSDLENQAWDEGVLGKRYERACALILADRLRNS